jgi:sulfate-transporting ATPase
VFVVEYAVSNDVCRSHILAFDGDSSVRWFEGGYSEYEVELRSRSGYKDPSRITFRKLASATAG